MGVNTKAASPVQAGTLGETASITQANHTTKPAWHQEMPGNSAEAQRQRLMAHLRQYGRLDTIEAREVLDVLHPAGRIRELRKAGASIQTVWTTAITEAGKAHRVARYILTGKEASND